MKKGAQYWPLSHRSLFTSAVMRVERLISLKCKVPAWILIKLLADYWDRKFPQFASKCKKWAQTIHWFLQNCIAVRTRRNRGVVKLCIRWASLIFFLEVLDFLYFNRWNIISVLVGVLAVCVPQLGKPGNGMCWACNRTLIQMPEDNAKGAHMWSQIPTT